MQRTAPKPVQFLARGIVGAFFLFGVPVGFVALALMLGGKA